MLGHTVIYSPHADDNGLLDIAHGQRMILLTRDEELHRRVLARNIPSVLVTGDKEEEKLAQLAMALQMPLDIDMAETKCPECGSDLRETPKEEVSSLVPAASLELYEQFWMCRNPDCGKVYWMGSHWKQIKQTLAAAKELAERRA